MVVVAVLAVGGCTVVVAVVVICGGATVVIVGVVGGEGDGGPAQLLVTLK